MKPNIYTVLLSKRTLVAIKGIEKSTEVSLVIEYKSTLRYESLASFYPSSSITSNIHCCTINRV